MDKNITYFSLLYLIILLLPIAVINIKLKLYINKKMVIAVIRMFLQLSLVGIFLQYIFKLDNQLLNLGYVLLMMIVASFSAVRSCNMKFKQIFLPVFVAFTVPNILILLYFNRFVVNLDIILKARHTIPIAGMLLGNSLTGIIIGVNDFYKTIKKNEKEYLYSLSLSCNKTEALLPYFKKAILAAATPTLANMETIGLVALPGMMTGQILGGALPMTAIKYQIAIMLAIFVAKYIASILAIILTSLRSFDNYDMLK